MIMGPLDENKENLFQELYRRMTYVQQNYPKGEEKRSALDEINRALVYLKGGTQLEIVRAIINKYPTRDSEYKN